MNTNGNTKIDDSCMWMVWNMIEINTFNIKYSLALHSYLSFKELDPILSIYILKSTFNIKRYLYNQ